MTIVVGAVIVAMLIDQERDCRCASRNHRSLSTCRDTSVNRSFVLVSPRSSDSPIARRVLAAYAATRSDTARTASMPFTAASGY